jgi:prepilin-type processing-associated H-X9-DG protein
MLLPHFEEEGLKSLYNPKETWQRQWGGTEGGPTGVPTISPMAVVPATVIPVFFCPSCGGDNPYDDIVLNQIFLAAVSNSYKNGQLYGTTTYGICKGATDTWCNWPWHTRPAPGGYTRSKGSTSAGPIDATERGMFDLNYSCSIRQITDGTSKTIAMGEITYGPGWPLDNRLRGRDNGDNTKRSQQIVPPNNPTSGQFYTGWTPWICGQVTFDPPIASGAPLYESNMYFQTLEPINKNPISHTLMWSMEPANCNPSTLVAVGHKLYQQRQGNFGSWQTNHMVGNARSDHPGGANFLFADGSVHFLAEDSDMLMYQWLSTIAGEEVVEPPTD